MIEFFTKNVGWKLFSLLVAVLLWIFVASEPELATFTSAPVQYKDLPPDLEISSDVVESVYLELRGPSGELPNLTEAKRYAVVLDMSGVQPGERTFSIGSGNVKLPRGLHLIRAIPAQLRFAFERRAVREVSVRVRFAKQPSNGYEVAHYEVSPSSLQVVGPESRVARIGFAVTDPIDLAPASGDSEYQVNTFLNDSHVRFETSPQVTVKVSVKKK